MSSYRASFSRVCYQGTALLCDLELGLPVRLLFFVFGVCIPGLRVPRIIGFLALLRLVPLRARSWF